MTDEPIPLPAATLSVATAADAPELLVLQRCCWVTEAIVNDSLEIPALHEDLATVREWIDSQTVWTVRDGARLVGAVRAHDLRRRWQIGRLMVAPDLRGIGLGRWLLRYVESQAPQGIEHFDLFTGQHSERNIGMYRSAGYEIADRPAGIGEHIRGALFLTKPRIPAATQR